MKVKERHMNRERKKNHGSCKEKKRTKGTEKLYADDIFITCHILINCDDALDFFVGLYVAHFWLLNLEHPVALSKSALFALKP